MEPTSWLMLQVCSFSALAFGIGALMGYGFGFETGLKAQYQEENNAPAPAGLQEGIAA